MHLSEINIYPVKSLGGIGAESGVIEQCGLALDRRLMLVDAQNSFISQREYPAMATIELLIENDSLHARCGGDSIEIPPVADGAGAVTVKVWSSRVKADLYGEWLNDWFSERLGVRCRLVRMSEHSRRTVNPFYAVRKFKDVVSFADGYPFMLTTDASLLDLNSRLAEPLPMNRFRPNFVVAGTDPFAEDGWKKIRIGGTVFDVVKPCARCVITTIDQLTGTRRGTEPLATLSRYRSKNGKVLFGQNLIAENAGGIVRVGDALEVLETR